MAKDKVKFTGTHIKMGKDSISMNIIGYVLITLFSLLCLLPFYLIIVASFTPNDILIREGYPLIPKVFSTEAYDMVIKTPGQIIRAYIVTIGSTVLGTFLSVWMSTMTGYCLSRRDFPWRNFFAFFFFFTTLFSGGLVPWYILCTRYLGFKGNFFALVIPGLFSVFNMIIAKSFMLGLPAAITESAKIDGANDFVIYVRLIIPLCKPLVATLGLFSALGYWNDWYNCMLFLSGKQNLYNLQYTLQTILASAEAMRDIAEKSGLPITALPLDSMKMAMTVLATGPIVLLYPFVQRYFVKGLTIGAVKG